MSGLSAVELLANQLMSYFGDADDAEAIARIREDARSHPETKRAFTEGLERALSDPACDRVRLVRDCANRRGASEPEARAWLERLRKAL